MKILSSLLLISAVTVGALTTSCTKEVVKETLRDSIIIRHDSVIVKQDVAKLFPRKWFLQNHEIEYYSGTSLVTKKEENFVANGFYNEFKANGTYTNFDLGGITNGTWELVDDNLYVLDKNTVNERYYYILSISPTALINRGPFTKNNQLLTNYIFSAYFKTAL